MSTAAEPDPARLRPRAAAKARSIVNIGPSHPATHGTIQIVAELDGERVVRTDVHCGYLHRGFEKECESHTWHNLIPYVDRLNYCSALINDFAYCEAVEKLMGIEITPRCQLPAHAALRVLAHRRPPDLHRRRADGTRRDDRVPVPGHDPRLHLRAPRRPDRRPRHLQLRPHRRPRARPARGLAQAAGRDPGRDGHVHRPRARPRGPQPHLHRPHARRRRALHGRKRSTGASPARSCAPPARRATCARTRPTSPTRSSTSRSRSASRATTTTGTTCACARSTSRRT